MDKDKTGFLNASELQAALQDSNVDFTAEQISKIISEIDDFGNGKINYSEFLAATISTKRFMTEEKMWMMFKHFDVDDTDYISKDNIAEAMQKLGKTITAEEIQQSLKIHDIKQDGRISFEEFKIMFQQDEVDPDASDFETEDMPGAGASTAVDYNKPTNAVPAEKDLNIMEIRKSTDAQE